MLAPATHRLPGLLEHTALFRELDAADRMDVAARMVRLSYARGQSLLKQGEHANELYLIASGLVSIIHTDQNGDPTEVAQLGRGEVVGELSLLTGDPPNATVLAILDTEVWSLSHADFRKILARSIPLALSVNRILSGRLAAMNERVAPQRTARLTAIIGDHTLADKEKLPLELAASVARYSGERVLLIDCFPPEESPLRDETPWGDAVDLLLREPARFAAHMAPANPDEPHHGARLIRHTDVEGMAADPGSMMALAAKGRSLFRHILFLLPARNQWLRTDILPLVDEVVAITHRNGLDSIGQLLERPEVEPARKKGLLAVTGWPGRFRMGDVWAVEEEHGWKVGALIDENARQEGVDRLARAVAKMRVGIAWGAGTARGWALAGIANALEQLRVPMDAFAGTSAGALGAAVYGLSLDYKVADERMRSIIPFLKRTTRPFLPLTVSRYSLLSEKWWNNLIRTFVGDLTFADTLLPCTSVALDLTTGQQHVFREGPLWEAIRASSSVPGLAPATLIEGNPFVDGAVVNAMPLDVVRDMGADILIGIDLTGAEIEMWGKGQKPSILATLLRTYSVASNTAASRTIPLADVIIRPTLRAAAVHDLSVMDEFMAEGERATLAALPELRRAMPWLDI